MITEQRGETQTNHFSVIFVIFFKRKYLWKWTENSRKKFFNYQSLEQIFYIEKKNYYGKNLDLVKGNA